MRTRVRRRRGFLAPDMIIGIAMLATLTLAMAYAGATYYRADQRLAARRLATRAAEEALAAVQGGQTPEAVAAQSLQRFGAAVTLRPMGEESGRRWLSARAQVKDVAVELVGLGGAQ